MAKTHRRPTTEQCTYCRREIFGKEITDDYVISRRWYPPSTPSTVRKWRAWACERCNNEYSHLEQYLLVRLAMCVNPAIPASAGVWERAKRAMDYRSLKDPIERAKRRAVYIAVTHDIKEVNVLPPRGVLPSFLTNFGQGSRTIVRIDANKLNSLIEKWALGIHRHVWGEPATRDAHTKVMHLTNQNTAASFPGTAGLWKILDGGPGLNVSYLAAQGHKSRTAIYSFLIWDQFRAYGTIEECAIRRSASSLLKR